MIWAIYVLAVLAMLGQIADAYTTYEGIFVLKVATEGNQNWFTQWMTKAGGGSRLLLKPGLTGAVAALAIYVSHHALVGVVVSVPCLTGLAYSGIDAGIHNYKINKAGKK